jgi:hypothetical protein
MLTDYQEYSNFVNDIKLSQQARSFDGLYKSLQLHDIGGVDITRMLNGSIGMSSEVAEILSAYYKDEGDKKICDELGDVMFYIFVAARSIDLPIGYRYMNKDLDHKSVISLLINLVIYTGEFLDIVKKLVFQGKMLSQELLQNLEYRLDYIYKLVLTIIGRFEFTVDDVFQANKDKLNIRYKSNFTVTESENKL